jgi:hypothetical protein
MKEIYFQRLNNIHINVVVWSQVHFFDSNVWFTSYHPSIREERNKKKSDRERKTTDKSKIYRIYIAFLSIFELVFLLSYTYISLSGKYVQLYQHCMREMFSLHHRVERGFLAWFTPFWPDCILCFAGAIIFYKMN